MRIRFGILWLAALIVISAFAGGYFVRWYTEQCSTSGISRNAYLEIYRLEPNDMVPDTGIFVSVPAGLGLNEQLAALTFKLSRLEFPGLPIEVLGIETRDGLKIARVDLRESVDSVPRGTWEYAYFQGSCGGAATQYVLTRTVLQPDYGGEWIDGVEFYYHGKPFVSRFDHIDLSGTILRSQTTRRLY